MTPPSPARRFAADLLEAERARLDADHGPAEACGALLQRLHAILQPLVGSAGYETVLGRAAVLGSGQHPELGRLDIPRVGPPDPDSVADVLERAEEPEEAAVTLVDHMLGFLGRLIGWRLTVRILEDEWPGVVRNHDVSALEKATRTVTKKES